MKIPPEITAHYNEVQEGSRLSAHPLELERTRELLLRYLPAPPATLLDVGGAAGAYSLWLAAQGYEVHLVDPMPKHIEQAQSASAAQPERPLASARVGDARKLDHVDASMDAVLCMGPLYHLTERAERLCALAEARRVLKPGGWVFAAAISRFASLLDGLRMKRFSDPVFRALVQEDLRSGQHRNPTDNPEYFTTAFFHHPDELRSEVAEAGFHVEGVFGVEGPAWLLADFNDRWNNPAQHADILMAARAAECEPSLLGIGPHLLAVGVKKRHE